MPAEEQDNKKEYKCRFSLLDNKNSLGFLFVNGDATNLTEVVFNFQENQIIFKKVGTNCSSEETMKERFITILKIVDLQNILEATKMHMQEKLGKDFEMSKFSKFKLALENLLSTTPQTNPE